jgi:hypothetical protein
MQDIVRIHQCRGGLVHLSLGNMTVRLDPSSFQQVAKTINAAANKLAAREQERQVPLSLAHGARP